jgi:hypothetical protein
MRDWILLDNGLTVNIFCYPNLVENIRTSNETLQLSTNGGYFFKNKCATVPGFGEVLYYPNAMTMGQSYVERYKEMRFRMNWGRHLTPWPNHLMPCNRTEEHQKCISIHYNTYTQYHPGYLTLKRKHG